MTEQKYQFFTRVRKLYSHLFNLPLESGRQFKFKDLPKVEDSFPDQSNYAEHEVDFDIVSDIITDISSGKYTQFDFDAFFLFNSIMYG